MGIFLRSIYVFSFISSIVRKLHPNLGNKKKKLHLARSGDYGTIGTIEV